MSLKVAVIAGTPVDTRMGVEFLEKKNREAGKELVEPLYLPVSRSCDEQIRFQYAEAEEKRERLDEIFDAAVSRGARDFFIYCNSLSGSFDFESYAKEKGVRVYTPLQVYARLSKRCRRAIGVLAANNLSLHRIEEILMRENPELYVLGTGDMQIVSAIEQGLAPEKIVEHLGLDCLLRFYEKSGCEGLVLGCTHFPYLSEALSSITELPLIDPAEEMFRELLQRAAAPAEKDAKAAAAPAEEDAGASAAPVEEDAKAAADAGRSA